MAAFLHDALPALLDSEHSRRLRYRSYHNIGSSGSGIVLVVFVGVFLIILCTAASKRKQNASTSSVPGEWAFVYDVAPGAPPSLGMPSCASR